MKTAISTDQAPQPAGAYSQLIRSGDIFVTAGFGPQDPATGQFVGDNVADQTRQVMENLRAVLATAGLEFSHVIKATVHLADLHRDFADFNTAYESFLQPPFPVRTTVGSTLAPGMLVEIDFLAHRA